MLKRTLTIAVACAAFLMCAYPVLACVDDAQTQREIKYQTRALEDQARSSERQERLLRDRNKMIDRDIRNRH